MRIDCARVVTQTGEIFFKKRGALFIHTRTCVSSILSALRLRQRPRSPNWWKAGRHHNDNWLALCEDSGRCKKDGLFSILTNHNAVVDIHRPNLTGILYLTDLLNMFQVKIVPFMRIEHDT